MFKVGDKVRRVKGYYGNMEPGDVATVKAVSAAGHVELVGYGLGHDTESLELVPAPSALDVQVGGGHYKGLKIQPVEYIMANNIPYMEGNIVKYCTRWQAKGGVEDLKKAKHYLELLIEHEEKRMEKQT